MVLSLLRFFGIIALGFGLFYHRKLSEKFFPVFLKLTLRGLFPFYIAHGVIDGWDEAVARGAQWMPVFFGLFLAMVLVQWFLARWYLGHVTRGPLEGHRREGVFVLTIQNATSLPLPLLATVVDGGTMVYMFFYVMAFQLLFWNLGPQFFSTQEGFRFRIRLNPPLVGLFIGIGLALLVGKDALDPRLFNFSGIVGEVGMVSVLLSMGGSLAALPRSVLRFDPGFAPVAFYRYGLYPAGLLLGLLALRALIDVDKLIYHGIAMAIMVEASSPPAINTLLVSRLYGDIGQQRFVGSATVNLYILSFGWIALWALASHWLFR